jgi:hypothetical protein
MAKAYLDIEIREGRGDEPCHIVDIQKEAKKRSENDGPQPKTRFQMECDDGEMYSSLNLEKDRIIKRARNKSVALSLMLLAWRRLTDPMIDKILAEYEGPPT